MIRKTISWFRLVAPPGWVVAAFVLIYLLGHAPYLCVLWIIGPTLADPLLLPSNGAIVPSCLAYGVFRVWFFHPLGREGYRTWLERTPWTADKALPNGPIHLVPQDAVLLAVMILLWHNTDKMIDRFWLPLVFLFPYLAILAVGFWKTGPRWAGYVLAFGLALVLRLIHVPWAAACVAGILYVVAYYSLRASLAQFPWNVPQDRNVFFTWWGLEHSTERLVGWPFDQLQASRPGPHVRRTHAILASLLLGWWAYVFGSLMNIQMPLDAGSIVQMAYSLALSFCLLTRIGIYCWNYWPPISLWGRLWTGRWIIPGYDQVFVTPLCALLVGAVVPVSFQLSGVPYYIGLPISFSLVLMISLNGGPSFERWRTTGRHRIVPGFLAGLGSNQTSAARQSRPERDAGLTRI